MTAQANCESALERSRGKVMAAVVDAQAVEARADDEASAGAENDEATHIHAELRVCSE